MKSFKTIPLSSLNFLLIVGLICISIAALSQVWEATNKIVMHPRELNDLNLDVPIIRPFNDVFFYLKSDVLKNDKGLYQKVQQNKLIIKAITAITYLTLVSLIFFQLRSFIFSLKKPTFFVQGNLLIVRKISFLLIIWVLVDFIIYQCIQFFIPLSIVEESINYCPINQGLINSLAFSIDFGLLLAAFAFYIISLAFNEGYQLKEQSDLTI
jgi:hypothetical protein